VRKGLKIPMQDTKLVLPKEEFSQVAQKQRLIENFQHLYHFIHRGSWPFDNLQSFYASSI